jgi:3-oxoacyl-ACP reductase-like protein
MEYKRDAFKLLDGKSEIRPLGSSRHRWECNIKGIQQEVMEWINVAEFKDKWWATENAVMNFQVP